MPCRLLLSIFFVLSFSAIAQELSTPVIVGEYADFLNAVAATDSHTLYHETMDEITRDGEPGDYHYEAVAGRENLPITFVTWFDKARYCNWKEHGSPSQEGVTWETTETGSYTLNDDMSRRVMKNSGAHYFLPTSEEDSFIDPTLASNDRGFTIVEVDGGDHFDTASFLEDSNPEAGDGTWSTFDEVLGAVGVLAVIGGGVGYAYHRCLAAPEDGRMPSSNATVAETTEANRRLEESPLNVRFEEVVGGTSTRIDVVTGKTTDAKNFAQDQRSLVKKWADWLRGHDHRDSIFQAADQIDYIEGEDRMSPEHQSFCQKFIRWMTQRAYIYKDVADFKKRNPKYLQSMVAAHEATIADHPAVGEAAGRLATIQEQAATIQEQNRLLETAAESARYRKELAQKALQDLKQEQSNRANVEGAIKAISKIERSCLYPEQQDLTSGASMNHPASAAAKEKKRELVLQEPAFFSGDASSTTSEETKLSYFQQLVELTQHSLITNLLFIERKASKSQHVQEEEETRRKIKENHDQAWKCNAQLMMTLETLWIKKELLWGRRSEVEGDFLVLGSEKEPNSVLGKIRSIQTKIPGFQQNSQAAIAGIQKYARFSKGVFEGDLRSNASREEMDRQTISNTAQLGIKKKRGFFSTSNQEELKTEAAEKELPIETRCHELAQNVRNQFSQKIFPITKQVEELYSQSYQLLHLAESNALLGMRLMKIYQIHIGKPVWKEFPLCFYLSTTLDAARGFLNQSIKVVNQMQGLLAGSWKEEAGLSQIKQNVKEHVMTPLNKWCENPMEALHAIEGAKGAIRNANTEFERWKDQKKNPVSLIGGWHECFSLANFQEKVAQLVNFQGNEIDSKFDELSLKIAVAGEIKELLERAERSKENFDQAMEAIFQHSIFQGSLLTGNQPQVVEEKED